MENLYKIFLLISLVAFILTSITACGRFSEPYPVEGSGFPHSYPRTQE